MTKELFKTIISRNQSLLQKVQLNQRDIFFEPNGNYVLVGVRHAGKSYMLYQRALQFLSEGIELHRIVFVNFDDERLLEMKAHDFDQIIQVYESMYADRTRMYEEPNFNSWVTEFEEYQPVMINPSDSNNEWSSCSAFWDDEYYSGYIQTSSLVNLLNAPISQKDINGKPLKLKASIDSDWDGELIMNFNGNEFSGDYKLYSKALKETGDNTPLKTVNFEGVDNEGSLAIYENDYPVVYDP